MTATTLALEALKFLMATKWKSIDKDNMEFAGRVTCFQLDKAREAIAAIEAKAVQEPVLPVVALWKDGIAIDIKKYRNAPVYVTSAWSGAEALCKVTDALSAIKAALEQPVQPNDDTTELEISDAIVKRMSKILAHIAITVNGPERPLHRHSYHDLAEKVEALQLEVDLYRHQAVQPVQPAPQEKTK